MDQKSEVYGQGQTTAELEELYGEEWEAIRAGKLTKERHQTEATARKLELNRQIQALKEESDRLTELVRKDPLTGLDNRHVFDEEMNRASSTANRPNQPPATLLYVDMDKLKVVNDSRGHAAGDTALREFANSLVNSIRPSDRAFRLGAGADEFAIILQGVDIHAAIGIVDRIRRAIEQLNIPHENNPFRITASFGVIPITSTIDKIKIIADNNLYNAKRAGGNRIGFIDANGKQAILESDPENPARNRTIYLEPLPQQTKP